MEGDLAAAKAAASGARDSAKIAGEHFETAARHLVQEMGDPSTTNYSDAFEELKDAAGEITKTSLDAYKEVLRVRMLEAGVAEKDVANWLDSKWPDVLESAKSVRVAIPNAGKAVKWGWLKLTAAAAAVAGMITFAVHSGHQTGQAANDFIGNAQQSAAEYQAEMKFDASAEEFQQMMDGLKLESIPNVDVPAPAQAAAEPAVAAMPAPVAAVAAVPVQVQVMNTEGAVVQQTSRTLGQVWQASPVSRPQIERYAGSEGSSGGGHQISGWTVSGTPFGSVHFGL